jgi:hypothetical protein
MIQYAPLNSVPTVLASRCFSLARVLEVVAQQYRRIVAATLGNIANCLASRAPL